MNEMWYNEHDADLYDSLEYGNSTADIIARYGRYDYDCDND